MPVFAIFEVSAPEFIREHLQQSYPDAHLEVIPIRSDYAIK